ncbi:MAG: ATP-binding protein [Planctomycetota bacterium]
MTTEAETLKLAREFADFAAAAHRLEASYAALKQRADAVDRRLASANRALQHALAERETILAALPVGVLALGDEGRSIWANPEGSRLEAEAAAHELDLLALEPGSHQRGELCLEVRRAALPGSAELLVVEDRSQMARLAREVDRLDRIAGLSELALGIAHEIKNPLNGVMGFAALMERSEEPEALRRYANRVQEGLSRVDGIVVEMMSFARAPAVSTQPEALRDILTAAADEAGVPPSRVKVAGAADAVAYRVPLQRVLSNLLRNSADAAGGGPVQIEVTVQARPEGLELEVRDDGPGIPAELGERVFEAFVTTKTRGIGLGLALAARVLSFVGGSLQLVHDDRPGACFRIVLSRSASDPGGTVE